MKVQATKEITQSYPEVKPGTLGRVAGAEITDDGQLELIVAFKGHKGAVGALLGWDVVLTSESKSVFRRGLNQLLEKA